MDEKDKITLFAKTNFRNREVPFGIKTDDRRRHMYIIGKTGMGKTTLMENMVIQDIHNGHGVAFLDPHGDSVQRILDSIPNYRVNDVVYFNPADMEYPLAFNILEAVDPKYKHLVASGLMGVFTKIWANLWSARMEYILNNTILALLDSPGNTLLGITRMYVDKKYRKRIVDNIKDPMVRAFWVDEFANYNEKYRTEAIAPIQNKVGQFLSSSIIRNIVGQPKSTIDLREIMDQRKILIMDLSKGKVGEDNSALLGAMIVTKLQLAAMSRTDIAESERKDFYLYVDEFQNFATESFATILSEARKYRLNLVVGHQYIAQLEQEKNTKVRDAIFGNVGTIVVFRIGAADAEFMETEFEPQFTPADLVNLPKYQIILKLMINGVASEPFSAVTLPPNPAHFVGNGEKVIKVSRERYANPALEVEEKISRWMGSDFHQESAALIGTQQAAEEQVAEPADAFVNTAIPVVKIEVPELSLQKLEAPKPPVAKAQFVVTDPRPDSFIMNDEPEAKPVAPAVAAPAVPIVVEAKIPDQQKVEFGFEQHMASRDDRRPHNNLPRHNNDRPRQQEQRREQQNKSQGRFERGHGNDRRQGGDRRQSNDRSQQRTRQPERKENPIWQTVHTLQSQKQREVAEKTAQEIFRPAPSLAKAPEPVVQQTIAPEPVINSVPLVQQPAPMPQSVPVEVISQAPMPKPPLPPDRTVLKPNQAYKI